MRDIINRNIAEARIDPFSRQKCSTQALEFLEVLSVNLHRSAFRQSFQDIPYRSIFEIKVEGGIGRRSCKHDVSAASRVSSKRELPAVAVGHLERQFLR